MRVIRMATTEELLTAMVALMRKQNRLLKIVALYFRNHLSFEDQEQFPEAVIDAGD